MEKARKLESRAADFLLGGSGDSAETDPPSQDEASEGQALITLWAQQGGSDQTVSSLVEMADANHLLQDRLGNGGPRSRSTRMGILIRRLVGTQVCVNNVRWRMTGGRRATGYRRYRLIHE